MIDENIVTKQFNRKVATKKRCTYKYTQALWTHAQKELKKKKRGALCSDGNEKNK